MSDPWGGVTYLESGVVLRSWDDLQELGKKEIWIFRGQGNASYTLKTSLERWCEELDVDLAKAYDAETTLLREFMRRFHHYSSYTPENEIEWFSIMRHHGVPTRFIDWTYSLQVATYFALERCSKVDGGAIWAMDFGWLHTKCRELIKLDKQPAPDDRIKRILWEKPTNFPEVFGSTPSQCVAAVNSFRLNERVTIQLGCFLAPGDLSHTMMENVASLRPTRDRFQKYVIPFDLRTEFLERLHYMNINRATLFPGLDGFAESLGVFSPIVINAARGKSTDLMDYRWRTFLPSSERSKSP